MTIALSATKRSQTGKKVKQLRRDAKIPAVLYGRDVESTALTLPEKSFQQVWAEAGSSQLIDLSIDQAKPTKILIQDIQEHPVSGDILHADLYQVKMTEKIETEIPLKFMGEAPAVRDLEGNLITEKDELAIRCLPADLVPEFPVDLSVLKTFDDVIKVADIQVPETIEVLHEPDEIVALVAEPRSEEELEEELKETSAEEQQVAIAEMDEKAEEPAEEGAGSAEKKETEKKSA